jgi:hypothetical protein
MTGQIPRPISSSVRENIGCGVLCRRIRAVKLATNPQANTPATVLLRLDNEGSNGGFV